MALISEEQWQEYHERGYVNLGRVIPKELHQRMMERIDDIMMNKVNYGEKLLMQLDPSDPQQRENYGMIKTDQTAGSKGATRSYRKIGEAGMGLECDDVFLEAMSLPIFKEACGNIYGRHTDISVYRSMVFNKPAQMGSDLPWHQDGGDWWALDRDPLMFVWTALDPATKENGCVRVVPGTHKLGLLSKRGHTLSQEKIQELDIEKNAVEVEVGAGESVMMHNWLVHSSGTNPSDMPRRAFSVNFCDGRTKVLNPKPVVQPENISTKLGKEGEGFALVFNQREELSLY